MKEISIGISHWETAAKTKVGCRGIVVKNGKILVTHETNTGYYLIPGGALENGETIEQCCISGSQIHLHPPKKNERLRLQPFLFFN